jgi:predicted nucleotidyltransferase
MKKLEEIKEILETHKKELKEKYKVRVVGIFGSYVHGNQKSESDIDLLAEFDERVSLFGLVGAEIYLSEILNTKVDLIPKKDIRPELKDTILKEAISL